MELVVVSDIRLELAVVLIELAVVLAELAVVLAVVLAVLLDDRVGHGVGRCVICGFVCW